MIKDLIELGKNAARKLLDSDFVRVISHNDADGIASAGIICNALFRSNIPFQATIVSRLDEKVISLINRTKNLNVLCDMGSGQPELLSKIQGELVILDHHSPIGEVPHIQINPHLAGLDGAWELSASGTVYIVAREMGPNIDQAGLAVVGIIGDKQSMDGGGNKFILKEAVENNIITVNLGLRMGGAPIEELLEYSTDPFLDITGDRERIRAFLDETDIHGRLGELGEDRLRRLTSAMALKMMGKASIEAIESIIGDVYILNREVIPNVFDMIGIFNACGKLDKNGLALSLCMRDSSSVEEAFKLYREYQKSLINVIRSSSALVERGENLWYIRLTNSESTGAIAGIIMRSHPDLPVIVLNEVDDIIKISARGTRKQVLSGLNLAIALREAASLFGGVGGGHSIAAGATIPKGKSKEFIEALDGIIGRQLRGEKA